MSSTDAGARRRKVGLPARPFLYTLDQVAMLLSMELRSFKTTRVFYEGRTVGAPRKHEMRARNIAPEGEKPDWRISEGELADYLTRHGFRLYERGWTR